VFNHLLLALDHPDDRRTLRPHFRRIAQKHSGRVTVMQMVSFLQTLAQMAGELSPRTHGDDESAEDFVEALIATLRAEGFSAEGFTDIGRNGLMVASAAERIDASLILMALRRQNLAQELFRVSTVPVLAVPVGRRRPSPQVLVPIEDAGSLLVIPQAAEMSRLLRAGITFVAAEGQELLPQARELADHELVSTEETLVADDLASTLLDLSGAMIVMRSPKHEVAARLIRESRIPLLVIRRPPPLPADFLAPQPVHLEVTMPPPRRPPRNPLEGHSAP